MIEGQRSRWLVPALLAALVAGCGGGNSTVPTAPARGTASCAAGAAAQTVTGSLVGFTSLTTPVVGGCSAVLGVSNAFQNITAGTYAATISLTAPAGLPPIPASSPAPPPGFSASTFTPVFYVTFSVIGFVGTSTSNSGSESFTLNSLTQGTGTNNFYTAAWNVGGTGTTAPPVSSTTFNNWSNSNNGTDVPLTVTLPNMLSIPAYPCVGSSCTPASFTALAPGAATQVIAVGYF